LSMAMDRGVEAVHVGVNRKNIGALQFWRRNGFTAIELRDPNARTVWMGTRTARN
jgi:ribosomal protein S18 acetylase RimI-like enzyme